MRHRKRRFLFSTVCTLGILLTGLAGAALFFWIQEKIEASRKKPDELFLEYVECLSKADYTDMYRMLDDQSHLNISEEDFITRHKNIYEGIEASGITAQIGQVVEKDGVAAVSYNMSLDSIAGEINFSNQVKFRKEKKKGYQMAWDDSVIFPELGRSDKVRVSTDKAKRGSVFDRNGLLLAGKGTASSVGLVPGKMSEDSAGNLETLENLLGISADAIGKKLSAKWVKEDSFVPLKTIKKVDELNLNSMEPREDNVKNKEFQDELLAVPGVLITDTEVRYYPLGESGAHLVGYVQNVTAEDLEKHPGEDYLSDSVIGRNGMEALFEKELKGTNGRTITITDSGGTVKKTLAAKPRVDGKDITLTIDSNLQDEIYQAFKEDKSCTVAMNPFTGEVLALVSTPSYDDNDFILGMSEEKWASLNEDERKPMFNRFRQRFAPGSSFKPITGAIGLTTGAIDPNEDFGREGLSWRKDESWGNYYVTTLHDYSPAILENAFIYSDNIYFAKAALKIGYDDFMSGLDKLGFNQEIPFDISVTKSQYSNTERIETEVQLADSGYGQGQMLVNPIHLASLYTMFANHGNVIKPYLQYKAEPKPEVWLPGASSPEIADRIQTALGKVISSEHGTGHAAYRNDIELAGKTGTAEIKASKDDRTGTELGWFAIYTTDPNLETPILLVSMTEDVKDRGGSGYVVRKDKAIMKSYIPGGQ
ncbi:penicillin-binding transpeptidase domain-containing protein [Lacrimispora sphenoides]|uniref:Penicillin-binding protein n=1 Tax=Lacrimispora sphenoides JCM 1415 TaxID=1297793 RepID=A0ABY1CC96_9FIRM|nr:penicillin-binding transpeptidase domain-containing protein [Lacrimispora sphenoides]SET91993.1 penicillin-binding protein [[Clostridium] sphenoides JCM 1415]SUY52357.1 peptidoglycan glycosyltransferase [Lacrimispora sphenoides]